MRTKEKLGQGTSCLVVSAGLSVNEREIWSGLKLPGGVRWAECVRNMIGHKLPVGVGWAECG